MRQHRDLLHRHDGCQLYQKARIGVLGGGALALWALIAGPAVALDFPALRDVRGVAAGDVLNIRAEPNAGAEILGEYAPDRKKIEILGLSPDGRWAEVGLPEGNGWVATRYLAATPEGMPFGARCMGTEPFWSVNIDGANSRFSTPEGQIPLTVVDIAQARNGFVAALQDDEGRGWQVIAQAMQCTDGMSDRRFGWRMLMSGIGAAEAGGGAEVYAGCCTLDGG